MLKILIIAPHSYCDELNKQRHCDIRAKEIAEKLAKFATQAGYDVKLILSDKLRQINDYNRDESFTEPWRQQIRDYIENNSNSDIIIFETHSFPARDTEFKDGSQVALLAIDEYYNETKKLKDYLTSVNINVNNNINNTRIVDLMVDTTKYKNIKNHYLLEFNEDTNILNMADTDKAALNILIFSLFPKYVSFFKKKYIMMCSIIVIIIVIILLLLLWCLTNLKTNYLGLGFPVSGI
jgi:hypothetical protein